MAKQKAATKNKAAKKKIEKVANKKIEKKPTATKAKGGKKTKKEETAISNPKQILKSQKSFDFSKLQKVAAPNVPTYKYYDTNQPQFPADYKILKNCVLQVTDIKDNHNKYYSLELHGSPINYRLFTHYGRTDDLDSNPNAGQKEVRYYNSIEEAWSAYQKIYKSKTASSKGYKPVNLLTTNIGSDKAKAEGRKAGDIGEKTQSAIDKAGKEKEQPKEKKKEKKKKSLNLPKQVQELIRFIYDQALINLTSKINLKVTAAGFSTVLGKLTIEQIEKGEDCLGEILSEIKGKCKKASLEKLSSDFFTIIPQKIGRSKAQISEAIIDNEQKYTKQMELMEEMKNCISLASGEEGNVFYEDDIDSKYKALGSSITVVSGKEFQEVEKYINDNLAHGAQASYVQKPKIKNIFEITLKDQRTKFLKKIGNEKLLFHGSRMGNWVGILSKGILMPQAVTKLGIHRTDFGWLGAGMYFGDVWQTSYNYTGKTINKGFILMVNVALGKLHEQTIIDGKIMAPPKGYDSIHGNPEKPGSQFADHEFCVYQQDQQYSKYLIEFDM